MSTVTTLTMNPSIDIFATVDELREDSKSRCKESSREPGGGGINVARNLHRLGMDVEAVFPCGGGNGKMLEAMLKEEGVPCRSIQVSSETRQNLAITERASGKMFHIVFPGTQLQESEWQECLATASNLETKPEYMVLSGSLPRGVPEDFHGRVAKMAAKQGIKVILDTSGNALTAPLKVGVYMAKLNLKEFYQLGYTGEIDHKKQLAAMAKMVEDGFADILILTLGDQGALLADRNGKLLHIAPPSTKVVSHVGAGDSFVSLMLYQLCSGKTVEEAFRFGVAAAAAAIQTTGNQIQDMHSIEKIYRELGGN